jgi:S-adenosyl-L-methionine hydrolase (adenosine-forming)
VIAKICPWVRIIDVTHGVPRQDVVAGAVALHGAIPFLPAGVHIAVVDPDVGAERAAVALQTADGRFFVGPDNGLLWPAALACGGVTAAVEISLSPLALQPVSGTFHGRDLFAPIAAHLARGTALADVGRPVKLADLVVLDLPRARISGRAVIARVISVDSFGNLMLGATVANLERVGAVFGGKLTLRFDSGPQQPARFVRSFAFVPAGELLVYENSIGGLGVAVSHGSAAERLSLGPGDTVRIFAAEGNLPRK